MAMRSLYTPDADKSATEIHNLLACEYSNPVRVIAFNVAERWCRDVTVEIADEVSRRSDELPEAILAFLEAARRDTLL